MYCNKCMSEITEGTFCKECMADNTANSISHHLKLGTMLKEKYLVGRAIGEGGFGITYVGRDTTLDLKVAIKEYYPNGYVNRSHELSNTISTTTDSQKEFFMKGKERFLTEARSLAKFDQEKGIVDVRDYFEENGTAYIIMEYLDGVTLSDYIKQMGAMDSVTLFSLMNPIMNSLQNIHDKGIIHRDISPDNIMILKNGTLKLMDFGAARDFLNQNNVMSIVLKRGYAPEEQYRQNSEQGPWTDVYSLCATMYRCITGVVPEDALDRLYVDNIKSPSQLGISMPKALEEVLMWGLALRRENRPQSMKQLMESADMAMGAIQSNQPVTVIPNSNCKTQAAEESIPQKSVSSTEVNSKEIPNVSGYSGYIPTDNSQINNNQVSSNRKNKLAVFLPVCITAVLIIIVVGFVLISLNLFGADNDTPASTDATIAAIQSQTQAPTQAHTQASSSPEATTAPEATKAKKETQPATKKPAQTDKNEATKPQQQSSNKPAAPAKPKTCTVNTYYEAEVGSTITYTCYLETPGEIEDVQAKVYYSSGSLKLVDTYFPVIDSSVICNSSNSGAVLFNAVNLDGFDFTSMSSLVTLEFEVVGTSDAEIYSSIEFVTGINGKAYVYYGSASSGVYIEEEIY